MMKQIINKFYYGFAGLFAGLKDKSIRLQYFNMLLALTVSFVMNFTFVETGIVLTFCAMIIALEYFNSALERMLDINDLTIRKDYKIVKDLLAGGILAASILALVTGLLFVMEHLK